ncbi:MAG: UDP-forming cellulose synthase catalytic subunit [Sutterellaceae bacterium]|nr:UDP-forming cellulose synthase catalytic subunit [Sutterellaceae bacterium]
MLIFLIRQFRAYFVRMLSRWADAGAGIGTLILNGAALSLSWLFLPLESKFWREVRCNKSLYYPHVNFERLGFADLIRIVLQSIFLAFVHVFDRTRFLRRNPVSRLIRSILHGFEKTGEAIGSVGTRFLSGIGSQSYETAQRLTDRVVSNKFQTLLIRLALVIAGALALLCITQPFDIRGQVIFLSIVLFSAWVFTHIKARITLMVLFVISVTVSGRYLWWRCTSTIRPDSGIELFLALMLLAAEIYAFIVMVLGYFQVCWVLDRKPTPLPADRNTWPTVDIFIPTYNESLEVIKPTVFAALNLDWPQDKLRVHLLDDGSREAFAVFAQSVGVNYIKRIEHNHAKAGNINHALGLTSGEFIVIFDCDHVPSCDFLTSTVGWLVADKKIALVQTPHHFYSPDPFEKNLHLEKAMPIENSLFHDFIQKGNDTWNAVMFCGSSAVMRRSALMQIGGIAVETVTEDAHTSLKLNRLGWKSAFISRPLASGLSTESLSAHIGQRIRWARGMIQIFRLDNPLLGKGLSLAQRLCFFNAMVHFLHGLPRLIFLVAPLPYMFADIYVIYATAAAIFAYVIPHMVHAAITNQILQKGYRYPFLSGVYEAVLSWYILLPTTVALIFPHKGKFNVTAKGMTIDNKYVDWSISKPILVLIALNLAGLAIGIYKAATAADSQVTTLIINIGWIVYNLMVLGAAFAVAVEEVQKHRLPRITLKTPVELTLADGTVLPAQLQEYSQTDVRIRLTEGIERLNLEDDIFVSMTTRGQTYRFKACVLALENDCLEARLVFADNQEEIAFNRCTFAREGMWAIAPEGKVDERFVTGFMRLAGFAVYGYKSLVEYLPGYVGRAVRGALSLLPRVPVTHSKDIL